jgi:hypothetical protein
LKNSENDKTALNYELKRMQYLDRIKIRHVKDKFNKNDEERDQFLPSIDTAFASCSLLDVGERETRNRYQHHHLSNSISYPMTTTPGHKYNLAKSPSKGAITSFDL